MFPKINNHLNFVPHGSLDRSPFAFKETWNRTYFCGAVSLVLLVMSTICARLFTDPILASGLLDHVYQPKWIIVGVVLCLAMYTIRDFLIAYQNDIVMNQRVAQANHWLSSGTYVIRTATGEQSFCMGKVLMLTSRVKDTEEGLQVVCIVIAEGVPTLVKARVDNTCAVIGNGFNDADQIRSMLECAAGEWRYEVAEQIGISFCKQDPAATGLNEKPVRQPKREKVTGPLSTPGSLTLNGSAAKH